MPKCAKVLATFCIGLMAMFGYTGASRAQQNAITAIDIALEPDATMIQHAQADNARLLKAFPKGFALDASHHPHISMLQQFVRTADLEGVSRRALLSALAALPALSISARAQTAASGDTLPSWNDGAEAGDPEFRQCGYAGGIAGFCAARGAYRDIRQRRDLVGRTSDVHPTGLRA